MARKIKTEADLATIVKEWFQRDHWKVYSEVAPWGGGASRADMVLVRTPVLGVVETKMTLGLSVLDQCRTWARYAHYTWAAVPRPKRGVNDFALEILRTFGIGLLTVDTRLQVHQTVAPRLFRKADTTKIRVALVDEQLEAQPGLQRAQYSTPYTRTRDRLILLVIRAGGRLPASEAIKALEHHYVNDSSARSSLLSLTERGVVSGLRVEREGKLVWFVSTS